MEWLVILGLAGLAWWQAQRIETLSRRMAALEQRFAAPPQLAAQAPKPAASVAPAAPELEPLLLDTPLAPGETEPLLLDTPLPLASNDDDAPEIPASAATPTPAREPPRPEPTHPQRPAAAAAAPRARRLEKWLAENALAYLGGGLLALGAIFLVAIAAQQSWFGPEARLIGAALLGAVLIGAGEWVLRSRIAHTLVAALLAGAGVVALYAAAWGAHALYGLIDWRGAAALLALAALLLIGLSFRHGQPLGVLAMAMALMTPALASLGAWPDPALTLFLGGVAAAGFCLAAFRRWAWVAAATLAGLYFWFAVAIGESDVRRALALLSFASLGGVALAFRQPIAGESSERLPWARAHTLAPAVAISISSVGLLWAWIAVAPTVSGAMSGPAWVGAMFVALAAAAVRARVAPAPVFAVAVGALASGFAIYLAARYLALPVSFYPFILFAAAIVVGSAIGAKPHRRDRALVAGAGGAGAALLTAFAAFTRPQWHAPDAWAPLFIGAGALFAAAWIASRDAQDERASAAVDFWALAAAALIVLGVESLFPAWTRSAAHASVALTFASGFAWRGWRALSYAALATAAIMLAYALNNAGHAASGVLPLWRALLVYAVAAGFCGCGAYILARRAHTALSEALSSAAMIVVLIAAFVGLRWIAAGGAGAPLDRFTETALRALTLLAAGHMMLPWGARETGRIGALRGHVLMALGFVLAALMLGLAFNPWWGGVPEQIAGPPIFNPLLLAFAAPAALFFTAARRLYARQLLPARLYAGAGGLFALTWAVLECRRLFHGAEMAHADVTVFEAACYALILLLTAIAIALVPRLVRQATLFSDDLGRIRRACAWAAMGAAVFLLVAARHPWWGGQFGPATDAWDVGLATFAHGAAVILALALGRALSLARGAEPTRFAAAATAALLCWSFGHAAIRWIYHFGAMDDGGPLIGLEGLMHTLWPLAFVLLAAVVTARAPGRDTVRAYLYDLQAIWSAAVWPATAFAALGGWWLFNPWWGIAPAQAGNAAAAIGAVALFAAAAWMNILAPGVPHVRARDWLKRATRAAAAAHLFVAITLAVRAAFHAGAITPGAPEGVEMWTYSAVWALYGALVLGVGVVRDDSVLRWSGLAILFAATFKVFLFDMARLSGVIRVASFLGLGAVLTATALAMRRFGQAAPRDPGELLSVIPSGRRGRPRVRQ